MIVELNPEQARILDRAAKSGLSPEEVLNQAFAAIEDQLQNEDWLRAHQAAISAQIEQGFTQAERGELHDPEESVRILQARRSELHLS